MTDTLLKAYHGLPAPLRSVAASLRGLYLSYWRYSSETERLVEEALDRESWAPDQWKAWHEERLAHVLHRAATRVPYYREQWAARRRVNPQRTGVERALVRARPAQSRGIRLVGYLAEVGALIFFFKRVNS